MNEDTYYVMNSNSNCHYDETDATPFNIFLRVLILEIAVYM